MSVEHADVGLDGPYEPHGFTRLQILCLARQILAFRQINIRIKAMREGVSFNEEGAKRPVRAQNRVISGTRKCVLPRSNRGKRGKDDDGMIVGDKVVDAPSSEKSGSSSSSSEEEEDIDSDVTTEDSEGAFMSFDSSDADDEKEDNKTGFAAGTAHGPPATIATATRVRRSSRGAQFKDTFEESNLSESSCSDTSEDNSIDEGTSNRQDGDGSERCDADAAVSQRPQHVSGRKTAKKRKVLTSIEGDGGDQGQKGREVRLPPLNPVTVRWYENEEEATCSVCGEGEAVEDNLILLCEGQGCTVAVHQSCYGVKTIPEGKWLCDACIARREDNNMPSCAVCPIVGGALRRVHSLGGVVPAQQGPAFVHLACALWTPEMMLKDPENMNKVDISKLSASRVALNCEACGQAGGGTVQCSYGTCCRSFHVLCGRFGGQEITFAMDGSPLAFCSVHSKPRYGPARRLLARCLKVDYEDEEEAPGNEGAVVPAKLSEYEMQRQAQLRRIHEARERIFCRNGAEGE